MIRLNKFLAGKGVASRRAADELITSGAVKINGKVRTEMGICVDEEKDIVEVDEKILQKKEEAKRYFVFNKPENVITSTKKEEFGEKTVLEFFPDDEDFPRIFPVGRLDKDSCGLLLLTNDGDLTFELTHPKFEHEKEYFVEIYNDITPEMMSRLRKPFEMLGAKTRAAKVKQVSPREFVICLKEGKNRQIRRMVRSVGSGVRFLQRIRMGAFWLPKDLPFGKWQEISKEEAQKFLQVL